MGIAAISLCCFCFLLAFSGEAVLLLSPRFDRGSTKCRRLDWRCAIVIVGGGGVVVEIEAVVISDVGGFVLSLVAFSVDPFAIQSLPRSAL